MARQAREGFPRHYRIVRPADYRAIYDRGMKLSSGRFVLFCRSNQLSHHRLGLTVSRKIGSAVLRNRIKRRFREIFRRAFRDIPNHFDIVVNAKRKCGDANFSDLRAEFLTVMRKMCVHFQAGR